MPRTQADVDSETQLDRLTEFLAGKPFNPNGGEEYLATWMAKRKRARLMLKAQELLDACEFALTTFSGLSSDEFIAGGDRIARERLVEAIADANEYGFDSKKMLTECREAVERSIEINRATTL